MYPLRCIKENLQKDHTNGAIIPLGFCNRWLNAEDTSDFYPLESRKRFFSIAIDVGKQGQQRISRKPLLPFLVYIPPLRQLDEAICRSTNLIRARWGGVWNGLGPVLSAPYTAADITGFPHTVVRTVLVPWCCWRVPTMGT